MAASLRSTEAGVPGEGGSDAPVGGPRNPQQIAAQKRVQQSQAQVDEVRLSDGPVAEDE